MNHERHTLLSHQFAGHLRKLYPKLVLVRLEKNTLLTFQRRKVAAVA